MPWVRMEDTTHSHPAVRALGRGADDPERQINEALGWLARCASYSAEHTTDGFVPDDLVRQWAGRQHADRLLAAARRAKQIAKARAHAELGPGWQLASGEDAIFHIRTREEVELDRARRGTTRQQDAKNTVRLRDGDQCRYCQTWVDFRLRKGKHRGTYDHPDPADRDTFVVCCGDCNGRKAKRTPEQAGMTLHPAPAPEDRHFTPDTHDKLAALGLLPPRPGTQPDPAPPRTGPPADDAATGSAPSAPPRPAHQAASAMTTEQPDGDETPVCVRTGSEPDLSTDALPRQPHPGRDGTGPGRVGTGTPARASPAARRSRRGGRRARAD